jgi:hypothetical protein
MAEATGDGLSIATLVAVYFESEEPEERDAIFARIASDPDEAATTFLAAMMAHDEDPYLRVAAAGQLLLRGLPQAYSYLLDLLQNAPDDMLFEQALDSLLVQPDANLYAVLAAVFSDDQRDVAERHLAMLGMEHCDLAASLALFRTALTASNAATALPLELLCAALAALVRSATDEDEAAMMAFDRHIQTVPLPDPDDRAGLLDLCAESVALMAAARHPELDEIV